MDDLDVFRDGLERALDELVDAPGARRPSGGSRSWSRPRPNRGGILRGPRIGLVHPSRKQIRLAIALSLAVVLGGALIYTSFSAATDSAAVRPDRRRRRASRTS